MLTSSAVTIQASLDQMNVSFCTVIQEVNSSYMKLGHDFWKEALIF